MTPRQIELLSKLLSAEELAAFVAGRPTTQDASAKISDLLAANTAKAAKVAIHLTGVSEPTVPVSPQLQAEVQAERWAEVAAAKAEAIAEAKAETKAEVAAETKHSTSLPNTVPTVGLGYYVLDGTIYRVRKSRSGRSYAEAFVRHAGRPSTWEYQKGVVYRLTGPPLDWDTALRREGKAVENEKVGENDTLKSQVLKLREQLTALQADLEALV